MRGISVVLFLGLCVVTGLRGQEQPPRDAPASVGKDAPPGPPVPDARGVYHGSGHGLIAPVLIYSTEPEFSKEARKKKMSGDCTLSILVDVDGRVQEAHVVKSIADGTPPKLRDAALSLDQKAMEAAKQYRFKPATYGGKAVSVELTVSVNFQIY